MKKTIIVVMVACAGIAHAMEHDIERGPEQNLLNTGLVMPVMPHSSLALVTSQANNSPTNTPPGIILPSLERTQVLAQPVTAYVPQAVINIPVQQYYARIPRFVRIHPIMQESREFFIVASAMFAMGVITGMKLSMSWDHCNQ